MSQQIDKRIMEKIQELVGEGVRKIGEMERTINVFAKNDIFKGESLPPQSTRRFSQSVGICEITCIVHQ